MNEQLQKKIQISKIGKTYDELAHATGVNKWLIKKICIGKRKVSRKTACRFYSAKEITLSKAQFKWINEA